MWSGDDQVSYSTTSAWWWCNSSQSLAWLNTSKRCQRFQKKRHQKKQDLYIKDWYLTLRKDLGRKPGLNVEPLWLENYNFYPSSRPIATLQNKWVLYSKPRKSRCTRKHTNTKTAFTQCCRIQTAVILISKLSRIQSWRWSARLCL